jgi:putative ABC transport system substrate-binding protein
LRISRRMGLMAIGIGRRQFIATLGGAAATWPLAARAQRPTLPVVGLLQTTSAEDSAHRVAGFREGLKQAGYTEGQNVTVDYYYVQGQYDQVPAKIAELVARQVSVIVGTSLPVAVAAKAATTTIPIVFSIGDDPVKWGLVASMNRPGGNITGVSFLSPAIEAKRVELLHELIPNVSTIAALVNPAFPAAEVRATAVRSAAGALGLQLTIYNASSEGEIETAFAAIAERRTGALLITTDPFFAVQRDRLVALAVRYALPAIYITREFAAAGGLMSYGSDIADSYRQAGVYTGRILKGEKPADLPVVQPTKFELVINLKTAKALDLTVPQTLLVAADEVIE